MYTWLEKELSQVKTPKFHLVDGPADSALRKAVCASSLHLPKSYQHFVVKYGNVRLYRNSVDNSYRIGVFAGPRKETSTNGTHIYHIGYHDSASVYIKSESTANEFKIYEWEDSKALSTNKGGK